MSASAELSIKEYAENRTEDDAQLYVTGVAYGISWANNSTGQDIYCPPNISLSGRNYLSMLDNFLEKNKSALDSVYPYACMVPGVLQIRAGLPVAERPRVC